MPALIAHIVYSFKVGGLENGVINLINRLPAERYRHAIVAMTDADAAFCSRIRRQDVEVIELHKPPGQGIKLFPRMFRLLRSLHPSVVHTRNLAALEMSVPAWLAGVPVRVHGEHGRDVDDPEGRRKSYQWMRRAYRPFVHHFIALSRDLECYLQQRVHVRPSQLSLFCNGVDAQRFCPAGKGRCAIEGSPFNDPQYFVLGTVGRMQAVKDHASLIRAFAALVRQGDAFARARLIMVGDGPLRAAMEALARSEGVADRIWFCGERSDIPVLMQGMDCFVLPSLAEGISNTVLEAMACALPVVATSVGGNVELVQPGTGSIVPPAQPQALTEAMASYIVAPERGRAAGWAARARIEAHYSLDTMVERYDRLYQRLLAAQNVF